MLGLSSAFGGLMPDTARLGLGSDNRDHRTDVGTYVLFTLPICKRCFERQHNFRKRARTAPYICPDIILAYTRGGGRHRVYLRLPTEREHAHRLASSSLAS